MAFNEERAPLLKGFWREKVFNAPDSRPMDLEIGTGNGTYFAHQALACPERLLIGIEIKYKPLIQSIRRALKGGATNAAICRFHALNISELFAQGELNNIFIHFPDPWTTPRKPKNRFVCANVLNQLYEMQKPGSFINFKTDSREYFEWSLEEIKQTKYELVGLTWDLHHTMWNEGNYITQFEGIFLRQSMPIHFVRLYRR
ncbi:MAG: tRNA (guanosine(46)-N7)-methyltransferase TrmB [Bdellovibrionota bacterium]